MKIKAIALAPKHNRSGKRDATGAFQPEAKRFLKVHDCAVDKLYLIDNHKNARAMRLQVYEVLERAPKLDAVAFFCHGTSKTLQFGFGPQTVGTLARMIAAINDVDPAVILYACLAGKEGGFAHRLRNELCEEGAHECDVFAHTTRGHTTRNPYVIAYAGAAGCGGPGGTMIVSSKDKRLWAKWRSGLRTDLRFRFPFMAFPDIYDLLCASK